MMNILEKEDLIKGLPDNVLQQQMQAPTGELPQYLLISEIQRRTDMRKSLQEQPKQESVSEQIMMEGIMANRPPMQPQMQPQMPPMPPQMPQMPMEQPPMGMAQGGVVRMANGGVPDVMTGAEFEEMLDNQGLGQGYISSLAGMSAQELEQYINNLVVSGKQDEANYLINQVAKMGRDPDMDSFPRRAYQDLAEGYEMSPSQKRGAVDEVLYTPSDIPTDIFSEGAPVQDQFIDSVKADDTEMKVSTTLGKRHTANQNPFYKTSMTERLGRSVKNPVFGDYDPNTKLGGLLSLYRDPDTTDEQGDLVYQQIQNLMEKTYPNIEDPQRIEADQRIRRAMMAERLGRGVEGIGSGIMGFLRADPEKNKIAQERAAARRAVVEEGIGAFSDRYVDTARNRRRAEYIQELEDKYGEGAFSRAGAQTVRSTLGATKDLAKDVGIDTLEAGQEVVSDISEVATPFFSQLFTGDDAPQNVTPDAETSSGAGIGDIIRGLVMPGYNASTDVVTDAKELNQEPDEIRGEVVVPKTTGAVSNNAGDQSNRDNVPAPDDVVDPRITDDDGLTTYTTGSLGDYENRLKGILDEERRGGSEAMVAAGLAISEGKNIGQALGAASQAASQARDTQVERQLKAFSALSKNRQQNELLRLKDKVESGRATRGEISLLVALLRTGTDPTYAEEMARQYFPKTAGTSGKENMSIVGTRPG